MSSGPQRRLVRKVVGYVMHEGRAVRVVGALGVERYDAWPSKPEVHERHSPE